MSRTNQANAVERDKLSAPHRAAEDRWMQEVDRAHQEVAKAVAREQAAQKQAMADAQAAERQLHSFARPGARPNTPKPWRQQD